MSQLILKGEVVADVPELTLGQMIAIADKIEQVNAVFSGSTDNFTAGVRAAQPILDLTNILLVKSGKDALSFGVDDLPRTDIAGLTAFYFDVLLGSGLKTAGETTAGAADPDLAETPSPQDESPSATGLTV